MLDCSHRNSLGDRCNSGLDGEKVLSTRDAGPTRADGCLPTDDCRYDSPSANSWGDGHSCTTWIPAYGRLVDTRESPAWSPSYAQCGNEFSANRTQAAEQLLKAADTELIRMAELARVRKTQDLSWNEWRDSTSNAPYRPGDVIGILL